MSKLRIKRLNSQSQEVTEDTVIVDMDYRNGYCVSKYRNPETNITYEVLWKPILYFDGWEIIEEIKEE